MPPLYPPRATLFADVAVTYRRRRRNVYGLGVASTVSARPCSREPSSPLCFAIHVLLTDCLPCDATQVWMTNEQLDTPHVAAVVCYHDVPVLSDSHVTRSCRPAPPLPRHGQQRRRRPSDTRRRDGRERGTDYSGIPLLYSIVKRAVGAGQVTPTPPEPATPARLSAAIQSTCTCS